MPHSGITTWNVYLFRSRENNSCGDSSAFDSCLGERLSAGRHIFPFQGNEKPLFRVLSVTWGKYAPRGGKNRPRGLVTEIKRMMRNKMWITALLVPARLAVVLCTGWPM